MGALLDFLNKLSANILRAASYDSVSLSSQVNSFHQVVRATRNRVFELAGKFRRTDQRIEIRSSNRALVNHGDGFDTRPVQKRRSLFKINEGLRLFVVDIEFKK